LKEILKFTVGFSSKVKHIEERLLKDRILGLEQITKYIVAFFLKEKE
jgi:hypothetical protein